MREELGVEKGLGDGWDMEREDVFGSCCGDRMYLISE